MSSTCFFSHLMYFVGLAVSSAKQSLQMEVKGVYEECCQNRSASNSFIHVSPGVHTHLLSFLLADIPHAFGRVIGN